MDNVKKMFASEAARSKELSLVIEKTVQCGRLLMDEDDIHFLKEKALEAAKNWATIEANLAQYGRVSFINKKFAVKQTNQVEK